MNLVGRVLRQKILPEDNQNYRQATTRTHSQVQGSQETLTV